MKKRSLLLLSLFLFSFKSKERLCFHDTADLQRKNGVLGKWMWVEKNPQDAIFMSDNHLETFKSGYYFVRKSGKLIPGSCVFVPIDEKIKVTSHLGSRRVFGEEDVHLGTDIHAEKGTHVHAVHSGIIKKVSWNKRYGHHVIVQRGALKTLYAHLVRPLGYEGESIEAGSILGLSGSSGRSTGPHLHFEMRIGGASLSPNWEVEDLKI